MASDSFGGKMSCGGGGERNPCMATILPSSTEEFNILSTLIKPLRKDSWLLPIASSLFVFFNLFKEVDECLVKTK